MILFIILILCFVFIRFFWNWRPEPWPTSAFDLPPIQVHRGYWKGGIQENTIAAFREARRLGALMVELDVQLSKDGIPIVFHDKNILRFNNDSSIKNNRVNQLTAKELFQLVQAPTLEDVLSDSEVPLYINIELKSGSLFSTGLEFIVADVIKKTMTQKRVLFSSFNPFCLLRISKLLPDAPRALLATNEKNDPDNKIYLRQMWFGGISKAHMVNLDHKMLTPFLMKRLEERKIPVAAWTVNDETRALILKNQGIISIITDTYPL